ncbi:exo-alpha-sialidase [bacterium]|nr:exo-alpha-sialidase [candidate division CSSED10-310 bacterium]
MVVRRMGFLFFILLLTGVTVAGAMTWRPDDIKMSIGDADNALQGSVDVAYIDEDTLLAVYDDDRFSYRRVFYTKSVNGGLTWSSGIELDTYCGMGCETYFPRLSHDPAGGVTAVVYEKRAAGFGYSDIYCTVSTDGGQSWTEAEQVNDDTGDIYNHFFPHVGIDATDQTIHVTWDDQRNGNSDVFHARSNDLGASFSINTQVNTWTDPAYYDSSGAVTAFNGDNVWVAFMSRYSTNPTAVYVSASSNGGTSFGAPVLVYSATNEQERPEIVYCPLRGSLHVVWRQVQMTMSSIFCATSLDDGFSFLTPLSVNLNTSGEAYNPSLAADATGDLFVAWDTNRDGYSHIFMAHSKSGGMDFEPDFMVGNPEPFSTEQMLPGIAVEPYSKKVEVAWIDLRESVTVPDIFTNLCGAGFHDGFTDADFSDWEIAVSVSSSTDRSADGDGYSCRFGDSTRAAGQLVQAYGILQQGSLDFWFWDGYGTHPDYLTTDFTIQLSYDDGTKAAGPGRAGVVRALGVVNASNQHYYQKNNGSGWSVITGIPRSEGWHRVNMTVNDAGILMELDPAEYPTLQPVHYDPGFTHFEEVGFSGGSGTGPYYLDSVHILTDAGEYFSTPALSWFGMLAAGLGLSLLLRRR